MENIKIKMYNTNQRTERYFNQLDRWVKRIEKDKDSREYSKDEKWLRKVEMFPINKSGDILLIINPQSFVYHSAFGDRPHCSDNELKNKSCEVIGLHDNTDAYYHPPKGDCDLIIRRNKKDFSDLYISPDVVAYGSSLPPYIFLPYPKKLKEFSKFLSFFAKKPDKLEKILYNYYKSLN